MKSKIRRLAAKLIGRILSRYSRSGALKGFSPLDIRGLRISYSQLGEDLVIADLLRAKGISNGVYVDIGAYHPIFYSNTRLLYLRGWRGINIDMDESKISDFRRQRPTDENVVAAVSATHSMLLKLEYESAAENRVIELESEDKLSPHGQFPISEESVSATPLADILSESIFSFESVEVLDIDCEGHDFQVLQGVDFNKIRPAVVCVEALDPTEFQRITSYMSDRAYSTHAQIGVTCIFSRNDGSSTKTSSES
ncbi:MAG: FkbM family methyltransferase [Fuerstiella sp.]